MISSGRGAPCELQPRTLNWASPTAPFRMEKGGPSPISPRHYRGRRRSSQCGPPLLTHGSGVRVPHPPVLGSRTVTSPSRGDGPSPAPAGSRSSSAGTQGRAPPRDASCPSPPEIPPHDGAPIIGVADRMQPQKEMLRLSAASQD
ncbi:hypothetical protein NDU88_000824 [Pleurodeles waltl]|uniref:Uncharacterized protein n=1 Tax=Pleurodeles waltl TaxID=8319 RepID=A0AAV7P4V4_PLEWA|nr:hypothetical protein NDU88_000824 [Pleurodeles waltl]